MDSNFKSDRQGRRLKDKSKHEKFGQYSAKHVRQVEQNLATNADNKKKKKGKN